MRPKVFPLPTVRAPSASNGPSALSWIMSWYITGPHNLRSFLAANSTQNFFLIARRFSFLWHSQQKCWINILGQNDTIFDIGNGEGGNKEKIGKCRERISLHFLSISSSFSYSLSIFSQPGCKAAGLTQFVQPYHQGGTLTRTPSVAKFS